jgi:hypothetical protein
MAFTGARSFVLSSLDHALDATSTYKLSFWASNTAVVISNASATLVTSGPTINGLTYFEYNIAAGNNMVRLTGNASIDELRLYKSNSRMRTTTYDPLIGKTSECDENNRITYYEYDNLGRLKFIKDENKNIVKMYEYNNVSQTKQNGCPGVYYNRQITEYFTKTDCSVNSQGTRVAFTVGANAYTSTRSQEDADAQAELYLLKNGPTQAIINGSCLPIYYNVGKSASIVTNNCEIGYYGGSVTYTVPAGRYQSTISQADVNAKEDADILANAQAFANDPVNAAPTCTLTTDPDWIYMENAPTYCQNVNGQLPAHLFVLETDRSPNSPTWKQTRWKDQGPNDACPINTYYNDARSVVFTKNDCSSGFVGSDVYYTVPAGKYSSTVSLAAANQQAINEANANGQSYANTNGACSSSSACSSSNCSGPNKKCVNGSCQLGVKIFTSSVYNSSTQLYTCTYHYEWSDGSWSGNYTQTQNTSCPMR